jgi:hypothetical protein
MEKNEIVENFTIGFFGSIVGGIFLATVLMQNPIQFNIFSKTTLILIVWLLVLYLLGIIITYVILNNFKKKKKV